ncbi:MAG: formylglycine-generating enzyme family protein [Treponema sp.]|nr:formylglycine-generating enzyme family protein [Treponema sp.]
MNLTKIFAATSLLCFAAFVWSCKNSPQESNYGEVDVRIDTGFAPEGFVRIPASTFNMGCTAGYANEYPVHQVTLSNTLYMSETEITQRQYKNAGLELPTEAFEQDDFPVHSITWFDAITYCNFRSIKEKLEPCYSLKDFESKNPLDWPEEKASWKVQCDWAANGYRLPTEAEWEYAARAGRKQNDAIVWSGTSNESFLPDYAWCYLNTDGESMKAVKQKLPNAWGLYDMSGNVQEFCWDIYNANQYTSDRKGLTDPRGAANGSYRLVRGGSYANYLVVFCSVSSRYYQMPSESNLQTGFRVVRLAEK